MKTVLLSTSSLWNCGDDFIRDGVLELLPFAANVRQLWWNRGFGIGERYANDLRVNLPLTDYFIVAGTPRWIFNNEHVYRHCLRHRIPMALIGVGTAEFVGSSGYELLRQVAASGLCEIALARDDIALEKLRSLGFRDAGIMLDPCFFKQPLPGSARQLCVVGWREQYTLDGDPKLPQRYPFHVAKTLMQRKFWQRGNALGKRQAYDRLLAGSFSALPEPRVVTVHDNREIRPAESVFGRNSVYYATDPNLLFKLYSRTRIYIGSRIHGAIPALIHGATVRLVYTTSKASVLDTARRILSGYSAALSDAIAVTNLHESPDATIPAAGEPVSLPALRAAIDAERIRVSRQLAALPILGSLLNPTEARS